MSLAVQFTPKQRDVLAILADGLCHPFDDMMRQLGYDMETEQRTLITYVSVLRSSLRHYGQSIVTERMPNGRTGYRRIVLLTLETSVLVDVGLEDDGK